MGDGRWELGTIVRTPVEKKNSRRDKKAIHLFISMLQLNPTLIKSHPNYDSLLQYGSLAP
jgi:hypothetical protein